MTSPLTSSSTPDTPSLGRKKEYTSGMRRYLAIDARESFITYAQTISGRLIILLIAMMAAAPHFGGWATALAVSGAMGMVVWQKWRVSILFATTWVSAFFSTGFEEVDTLGNIRLVLRQEGMTEDLAAVLGIGFLLAFFIAALGILYAAQRAPQSLLSKRPLIVLLTAEALLCGIGSSGLLHGLPRVMLWSAIFVLTPYLWFLPLAIVDLRSRAPSSIFMQMSVLRPFWSPKYLPYGKGAAFLRKHLSQTSREIAVTQLKAIKLLIWANLLYAMQRTLEWLFEDQMHIPSVRDAMDAFLTGHSYSIWVGWAAVVWSAADFVMRTAYWLHVIIGIGRLAGYRLPRATWRPLESRTLMDYFNRFNYYFKELLVDLFFIPTFFRVFQKHPRLRMFFATFMAAGVGNAIWHFTRDIHIVAREGLASAFGSYTSYIFYSVVLATGVGISQLRANLGFKPSTTLLARLYSFVFVWSFVACLSIFGDESRNHTLSERIQFLASLFGVSLSL
jgi:hypothetical protein